MPWHRRPQKDRYPLLEISSGTYTGREDEELGIYAEQEAAAALLMGAYSRFIGTELQREEL